MVCMWQQVHHKVVWEERVGVPIVYNGMPKIHSQFPELPTSLSTITTPSNTLIHRPNLSPQTASRSTRPFCHNTLSLPTDRSTDGIGKQECLRSIISHVALYQANVCKRLMWRNMSVSLSVGSRAPLSSKRPLLSVEVSVCLFVCLSVILSGVLAHSPASGWSILMKVKSSQLGS